MKRIIKSLSISLLMLLIACTTSRQAESKWPLMFNSGGSEVKVFTPTPESLNKNVMTAHATISLKNPGGADPVYGTFWFSGLMKQNGNNKTIGFENVDITDFRVPGFTDTAKIISLKSDLVKQLVSSNVAFSTDSINSTLSLANADFQRTRTANAVAPQILYSPRPAVLVVLDGEPQLGKLDNSNLEEVVNTSDVILHDPGTGLYYLSAGDFWFTSGNISGPWTKTESLPAAVSDYGMKLKAAANNDNAMTDQPLDVNRVPVVYISKVPAELLQSDGPAELNSVEGTSLSYVSNSQDNIFFDNTTRKYYAVIGGRWYTSFMLDGSWQYLPAEQLSPEFAKIPDGWSRDNVLASVPNTRVSQAALHTAQVPQVAKVDRKTATTTVEYDGDPTFEKVDNTDNTSYATNTSSSVLRIGNSYYCVDNGIWYVANGPNGPWSVATDRPEEVDNIPSSCPVYNVKYVYIYNVTPDYVYTGYTPCYTGSYIYGHTVVYGSGYHYRPWHHRRYYPRPHTWGYGMMYDPNIGWCFGPDYYFYHHDYNDDYGYEHHLWNHHHGGWWGPERYQPPHYYYNHYYDNDPDYHQHLNQYYDHQHQSNLYYGQRDVHQIVQPRTPPVDPYHGPRPPRSGSSGGAGGSGAPGGSGNIGNPRPDRSIPGTHNVPSSKALPPSPRVGQPAKQTPAHQPAVKPQTGKVPANHQAIPQQNTKPKTPGSLVIPKPPVNEQTTKHPPAQQQSTPQTTKHQPVQQQTNPQTTKNPPVQQPATPQTTKHPPAQQPSVEQQVKHAPVQQPVQQPPTKQVPVNPKSEPVKVKPPAGNETKQQPGQQENTVKPQQNKAVQPQSRPAEIKKEAPKVNVNKAKNAGPKSSEKPKTDQPVKKESTGSDAKQDATDNQPRK